VTPTETAETPAEAPTESPTVTGGEPRTRRRVPTALVVLLVVVLVASLAAVGLLLAKRADAEAALDDRGDVIRVAERFTAQVNDYDSGSVDDYKAAVGDLLSTKFKGEFDKAMEDIVASVKEAKMESEGTVLASGVATVDQDSARVLVVADADVKTVFDERERHFRWEVDLVKVDGRWLVDDFTPVS